MSRSDIMQSRLRGDGRGTSKCQGLGDLRFHTACEDDGEIPRRKIRVSRNHPFRYIPFLIDLLPYLSLALRDVRLTSPILRASPYAEWNLADQSK